MRPIKLSELPEKYRKQVEKQATGQNAGILGPPDAGAEHVPGNAGGFVPMGCNNKARSAPERDLQKRCELWLRHKCVEYLQLSPRAREKAGWPDLTFSYDGIPVAVELKTLTGKLTPDQIARLYALYSNGWHVAVIRSDEEWMELVRRLDEISRMVATAGLAARERMEKPLDISTDVPGAAPEAGSTAAGFESRQANGM